MVAEMEVQMVADIEVDKVANKVADMVADKVADMVAVMKVDKVALHGHLRGLHGLSGQRVQKTRSSRLEVSPARSRGQEGP